MKRLGTLAMLSLLVLATACSATSKSEDKATDSLAIKPLSPPSAADVPAPEPPISDSTMIVELAHALMGFAADKQYAKIADDIHPTKGIRFSPYPYVDVKEHKHFTADEFRAQVNAHAKKKVLWGTSDPLGEKMNFTVEAYFKSYGYDMDYLEKGKWAYNEGLGHSTTIDNSAEVYPGDNFVDFYYGGDDPDNEPFNWGSIRLVFEMVDGKPYVVAWIHNAWST